MKMLMFGKSTEVTEETKGVSPDHQNPNVTQIIIVFDNGDVKVINGAKLLEFFQKIKIVERVLTASTRKIFRFWDFLKNNGSEGDN